mgnify:CR=1 FL=1|jgi:hypothetical protein
MSNASNNEAWAKSLKDIRNAKNRLIVCFLTFPLYILAVSSLARDGNSVTALMLLYMLLYAGFGIDASVKRCPRCHEQFYVKGFFLNILSSKCAHCGLSAKAEGGDTE